MDAIILLYSQFIIFFLLYSLFKYNTHYKVNISLQNKLFSLFLIYMIFTTFLNIGNIFFPTIRYFAYSDTIFLILTLTIVFIIMIEKTYKKSSNKDVIECLIHNEMCDPLYEDLYFIIDYIFLIMYSWKLSYIDISNIFELIKEKQTILFKRNTMVV